MPLISRSRGRRVPGRGERAARPRRWCSGSTSIEVSTPSAAIPRSSHSPLTPAPVPISTTARAPIARGQERAGRRRRAAADRGAAAARRPRAAREQHVVLGEVALDVGVDRRAVHGAVRTAGHGRKGYCAGRRSPAGAARRAAACRPRRFHRMLSVGSHASLIRRSGTVRRSSGRGRRPRRAPGTARSGASLRRQARPAAGGTTRTMTERLSPSRPCQPAVAARRRRRAGRRRPGTRSSASTPTGCTGWPTA